MNDLRSINPNVSLFCPRPSLGYKSCSLAVFIVFVSSAIILLTHRLGTNKLPWLVFSFFKDFYRNYSADYVFPCVYFSAQMLEKRVSCNTLPFPLSSSLHTVVRLVMNAHYSTLIANVHSVFEWCNKVKLYMKNFVVLLFRFFICSQSVVISTRILAY